MKKLTILFLVISLNCFGQNDTVFISKNIANYGDEPIYKTDTIIFDTPNARNIIIGDAVLEQTENQQIAKGFGLFLKEIEVYDCKDKSGYTKPNKIIEFVQTKKEWSIKTLVYSNCCQDFLADIKIENQNTLNLIFYNYGQYCLCSCPFELTYKLDVEEYDDLKKINSIIINGDSETKMKIK